ncbi:hypothetical protein HPP92_005790 [Vanilla planifolia]|uniref:Rhodopsin n=1 Tax=Vanilla planifolia TaxID=51239 RepID=A0A835RV56_VANPL|nr:hypothetical protein HPP92_006076 [Vanilla planifolia]KAG0494796.1 hypothetical protein HPP92_005790 [Vanilla planifolia]
MSYYNQQQPPVGVPPPQGYPDGYTKDMQAMSYPVQGFPSAGYPPAGGYPPPQYAQQPPPKNQRSGPSFVEGW